MGFFSELDLEIREWLSRGRSVTDTYIHFKDYVTLEQVEAIAREEYDTDPLPQE